MACLPSKTTVVFCSVLFSLRRFDYTVIGDTVNVAQRLQGIATPGQILITSESYEKIKESFNCNKIQETVLKNKTQPIVLYEVLG